MLIERVAIEKINLAPYNPRVDLKPGDPEYEKLKRSIDAWGLVEPLVWNKRTGNLVGGHQRLKILRQRGEKDVSVSVVDLDDENEKALNIALNKIEGAWDDALLADLLQELDTGAFDISLTGFDEDEIERLMTWTPDLGDLEEDDVPDPPEEPVTRSGDLWALGRHRLLCGDSTNPGDVTRLMAGRKAGLMATDPPYLVNYQGGNRPQSGHNRPEVKDKHWDDYDEATGADFFSSFLRVALEHALGDHVAIYQWHAYRRQALVEQAWIENGLLVHQQIIWVKKRAVPARTHYMWQHESCFYGWVEGKQPVRRPPNNVTTVWEVDQKGERDGIHPTQKPVKLFADPIQYHLRQGGLCYEPFAGSGTCIVAAERLNRRCYAMELAPTYCDVIVERWQNLTGERAVREDGTTFDDAKTQARQAV